MKPIRLPVLSLALTALLAACGTAPSAPGTGAPPAADVTVTARDMAFASESVTVAAAGETFTVAFVNEDSMPHNIAIYADESKSEKLYEGEMVTDGSVVYDVPALAAGEYFFDCSLHPDMVGALVVEG